MEDNTIFSLSLNLIIRRVRPKTHEKDLSHRESEAQTRVLSVSFVCRIFYSCVGMQF